jgi:peptide/nickel transport system substrate-binding protein
MIQTLTRLATAMLALLTLGTSALAQGRNETLIVVVESGPNSMDIHGVGANRPATRRRGTSTTAS